MDTKETVTPKKRKLTKKQRGFIKDYIETGNGSEAAMRNYNLKDRSVARSVASENLAKPYICAAIREALPDELLAKVHLEGLSATYLDVPDYSVRHKYLDSAYKLKGAYAPEKSITMSVDVTPAPMIKELAHGLLENQRQGSDSGDGAVSEPVGSTESNQE